MTKVNKPAINRLLKGMGINPVGLDIKKNSYWTIRPFGIYAKNNWESIHSTITNELTNQGIQFGDYGHAIYIYL